MKALPLVLLVVLFVAALYVSRLTRARSAATKRKEQEHIGPGIEVMTTSGLYATVVRLDADETAIVRIAPDVEVRWALAALRSIPDLPPRYRRAETAAADGEPPHSGPQQ